MAANSGRMVTFVHQIGRSIKVMRISIPWPLVQRNHLFPTFDQSIIDYVSNFRENNSLAYFSWVCTCLAGQYYYSHPRSADCKWSYCHYCRIGKSLEQSMLVCVTLTCMSSSTLNRKSIWGQRKYILEYISN
jgi:hypothetical protein